ncbi:hypothetical protein E2C01_032733 [Portunus trituberculatus]|uniref:Uncharacterized protein n=1 Tax=Portunus trituberculatus TaxID=210409 RepID=A0A5B7F161_PORTR|nr:hypothetical protein [Portunus trituberculatus]
MTVPADPFPTPPDVRSAPRPSRPSTPLTPHPSPLTPHTCNSHETIFFFSLLYLATPPAVPVAPPPPPAPLLHTCLHYGAHPPDATQEAPPLHLSLHLRLPSPPHPITRHFYICSINCIFFQGVGPFPNRVTLPHIKRPCLAFYGPPDNREYACLRKTHITACGSEGRAASKHHSPPHLQLLRIFTLHDTMA